MIDFRINIAKPELQENTNIAIQNFIFPIPCVNLGC